MAIFICPDCEEVFHNKKYYKKHRREEKNGQVLNYDDPEQGENPDSGDGSSILADKASFGRDVVVSMSGQDEAGVLQDQDGFVNIQLELPVDHQQMQEGRSMSLHQSLSDIADEADQGHEVAKREDGVENRVEEEALDTEKDEDEEEDGEISEDMEEVERQELDTDNLDVGSDEDEDNGQEGTAVEVNSEEEVKVDQPEAMVEDNSSEPSSCTGARQVGREVAGSSLPGPGQVGFEQDHGETDIVVPTTPKLPLPRRNDDLAEAVSSPQVG